MWKYGNVKMRYTIFIFLYFHISHIFVSQIQIMSTSVIAIFDVGKTNKKIILFDEQYRLVYEKNMQLPETVDEDGFPCEDISALTKWVQQSVENICSNPAYTVLAINFSAYGASFVHLDKNLRPVTPLYNYLKPYPAELQQQFYDMYGGMTAFAMRTSSPVLGNLNSGMQLYWMKYERPELFKKIKYSLHLPQYLSFLISGKMATDITSIGCHTNLWDFKKNDYHEWVYKEGIQTLFSDIHPSDEPVGKYEIPGGTVPVGIGLHDSSAALIPYLAGFHEPFVLLSTGTWCISLNPFNDLPLTKQELEHDCLCYLTYQGKPVKASRLFAGYTHEQQIKRIAAHFKTPVDYYTTIRCDIEMLKTLKSVVTQDVLFEQRDLSSFQNYETAYHQLIIDLVAQQVKSTRLVLKGPVIRRIFVDGGFSKNPIYMHLLPAAFPEMEVFAASLPQATALGAALSIHKYWNKELLIRMI
jgi:sugar (pentulose or hexulose) kinase